MTERYAGEWGTVADQERPDGHAEHMTNKPSHNLAVTSSWQELSSKSYSNEVNGSQEQFNTYFLLD